SWHVLTKNEADTPALITAAPLDYRNQVMQDQSFAEMNLRRSNLSGATLRHVDLSGADLSESDLRNVRFEDVDLSKVKLCGSDLRGADLRGAQGLMTVEDWSYAFYDRRTRLPRSEDYLLFTIPGPIPDTGRDLLYMCTRDTTRRIEA
ncbi:MAG TPA: pentapeptide repeat-containing protein, partial [Solirubrobacterales bacterium]|nr:pentapeptide repeat-containing protein [Solirubrobacterales bacterium]